MLPLYSLKAATIPKQLHHKINTLPPYIRQIINTLAPHHYPPANTMSPHLINQLIRGIRIKILLFSIVACGCEASNQNQTAFFLRSWSSFRSMVVSEAPKGLFPSGLPTLARVASGVRDKSAPFLPDEGCVASNASRGRVLAPSVLRAAPTP